MNSVSLLFWFCSVSRSRTSPKTASPCALSLTKPSLIQLSLGRKIHHPAVRFAKTNSTMTSTIMKAYGVTAYGPIENLKLLEVPKPQPGPRDLLVKVKAIATNPVDTKKRSNYGSNAGKLDGDYLILGWDASGEVEAVGSEVSYYKPGDHVYFAGSVKRPGCNAEYTLIDERITGRKPKTLTWEEAAAIPLTGLTSWEGMNYQMNIPVPKSKIEELANSKKSILIVGGAGGVGSIAIQIAKRVLHLNTIATASREESGQFCKKLGADHIVDHSKDFTEELKRIGFTGVDYILNTNVLTQELLDAFAKIINPLGRICCIVSTSTPMNLGGLFVKSVSFSWELMFTRAMFNVDLEYERHILDNLSELADQGIIVPRATVKFDSLASLGEAHKLQESGKTMGKIVLSANF